MLANSLKERRNPRIIKEMLQLGPFIAVASGIICVVCFSEPCFPSKRLAINLYVNSAVEWKFCFSWLGSIMLLLSHQGVQQIWEAHRQKRSTSPPGMTRKGEPLPILEICHFELAKTATRFIFVGQLTRPRSSCGADRWSHFRCAKPLTPPEVYWRYVPGAPLRAKRIER